MNCNLEELEHGQTSNESFYFKEITWKIPHILSPQNSKDCKLQSAPFSFADAIWRLEIYPNGETLSGTEGYINLAIIRLNSEIPEHHVSYKLYFKTRKGRKFDSFSSSQLFNAVDNEFGAFKYIKIARFKQIEKAIVPNGILTVVCQMKSKKIVANGRYSQLESTMSMLKIQSEMNCDLEELEHGQTSNESFYFKEITWKIPHILSLQNSKDCKLQSALFSFADAIWRLEFYPNGETLSGTESYINLAIIRLNSEIPEHHVSYKLYFKTRKGRKFDSFSSSQLFNAVDNEFGAFKYMKILRFKQMKKAIVTNGILTVVCQMRSKKMVANGRHLQLESTTSILSPDMLESNPPACLHSKILHDFKEFFLKKEGCDVLLKVKGFEFPAHRSILSARSLVFASAFGNDMKEKITGIIDIEDCDPSIFSDFLCFLYCGDIQNLSSENVLNLFIAADKYDVSDLKKKCIEFMKENLSVDTFFDTIILALRHFEAELIKLTTDFFIKNVKKIIVTVKWQSFVKENPIQSNELLIKALVPDFNKTL